MGYAFSDTPWRNIDFSTPESGDSALLDVFTLNENTNQNSLEAGKVDLNTRQPYVLAAVLSNAYVDDAQLPKAIANSGPSPTTGATLGSIQLGNAKNAALTIAQALVNRTTDSQDVSLGSGPLQNISELVGKYVSNNGTGLPNGTGFVANGMNSYAGFSGTATPAAGTVKPFTNPNWTTPTLETNLMNAYTGSASGLTPLGPFPTGATPATATGGSNTSGTAALPESLAYIQRLHEAPIRALANVGQTRVWNLMIDVIAQTGRFPSTATSLQSFVVEGERRYWVHVAIDRLTGKVLDEQVEVVKE
jgi:hypothetical protein